MTDATHEEGVEVNARYAYEDRLAQINAIAGDEDEQDETPSEEPAEDAEQEEPAEGDQSDDPEEKETPAEEEPEKPRTRVLKVDGQEIERTEEEILEAGIRALQKESTADKRLEEATRLLREAQNTQLPRQDVAQRDQQPSIDADLVKKIQYGSEEEAVQAMQQLMTTVRDQATQQAAEMTRKQLEQERLNAIANTFKSEFKEIVEDPYLYGAARNAIERALNDGQPNEYDTYKREAQEVLKRFGRDKTNGFDEKLERKRSTTQIKSASTKPVVAPKEKPQTAADVIAEIAKARGQMF